MWNGTKKRLAGWRQKINDLLPLLCAMSFLLGFPSLQHSYRWKGKANRDRHWWKLANSCHEPPTLVRAADRRVLIRGDSLAKFTKFSDIKNIPVLYGFNMEWANCIGSGAYTFQRLSPAALFTVNKESHFMEGLNAPMTQCNTWLIPTNTVSELGWWTGPTLTGLKWSFSWRSFGALEPPLSHTSIQSFYHNT